MHQSEFKIMLIDDNQDDCEAIIRAFKYAGWQYPIECIKSASEALKILQDGEFKLPDIILLDLNMPGMDGRAFISKIKEEKHLQHISIIVMTTSLDQSDIQDCYSKGVSSYIQKPISFNILRETCKTIVDYWFKTCSLPNQDDVVNY